VSKRTTANGGENRFVDAPTAATEVVRAAHSEPAKSSYQWVPLGGLAITLFSGLGFAAGRAYVWTYWGDYGVASVFTLPIQDVIYIGFTANVAIFFQTLLVAIAAFVVLASIAFGSRAAQEWIDKRQESKRRGPKSVAAKAWTQDDAGVFFSRAVVVTLALLIMVVGVAILLRLASQQARERAEEERKAFASWNVGEMARLHLTLVVASSDTADRGKTCGFVIENSDKLVALNDGIRTQVVPLDKDVVRIRMWALRLHEAEARRAAACECGLKTVPEERCSP
jgi:hypothetical protein